ncbi:hypothetical protein ACJIZ3_023529 [Penstemon smallii]|uniref:Uncharacterized protein n=1 Tax=Penstemon smallii TaxID=265156 RepID=A0ABD3TS77_9LAMI
MDLAPELHPPSPHGDMGANKLKRYKVYHETTRRCRTYGFRINSRSTWKLITGRVGNNIVLDRRTSSISLKIELQPHFDLCLVREYPFEMLLSIA